MALSGQTLLEHDAIVELREAIEMALESLGTRQLDVESAARTLGAVVKYREDAQRVRQALDRMLAG